MSTDENDSVPFTAEASSRPGSDANPKKVIDTKRVLACGTCRKRKLKCDSKRPKCSTCARLGHPCEYDEVRKKSGPKRGYVKSLEARLNQLESQLDNHRKPATKSEIDPRSVNTDAPTSTSFPIQSQNDGNSEEAQLFSKAVTNDKDLGMLQDFGLPVEGFSWDMVSLGLEEPLPTQEVMDELYQIYFTKIHPSMPMIHRTRFLTSLTLAPNSRPPVCLRYMIFAHACSIDTRYSASAEQFYRKARKYVEQDEMKGLGESFATVAHAQCWSLIATYEFKYMYFPRAWLSVGRAGRLVQLLGLHRQDRVGLDVKQTLPPPRDWVEKEERRRTFWNAYNQDRYASIGTGWPMMFDEKDILTSLPASEQSFLSGRPEPTPMLEDVMSGDRSAGLSAFGSVILLATLFGRNLTHLHRPSADDNDNDLNGEFWRRHRSLDNILLNVSLSLPPHLRLPHGINDSNIVFCNMSIHTSAICLHQAAIFKADKHKLTGQISAESKRRCLVAADQITSIMKMISHQDLTGLNPFLAFSLYVAARVFVQYLKFKKEDHTIKLSLMFLLHAMQALKVHNPLTESFLVQLDVDLEGSGIDVPAPYKDVKFAQRPKGESPANTDAVHCCPLAEIRETQQHPDHISRDMPILPADVPFTSADFDSNPYFSSQGLDSTTGCQAGQISSHLTPSSTSQSNHATPSGLSGTRRASSAGTSPQSEDPAPTQRGKIYEIDPEKYFLFKTGVAGPGVVPEKFNMSMQEDNGQQPQSPPFQTQRQHASRNPTQPSAPSPTDFSTMDFSMNMNVDSLPSGFTPTADNNIGHRFAGFSPGPSGLTPGATGLTPGRYDMNSERYGLNSAHDGMAPGSFDMSTTNQWQGPNMMGMTNETDQWIFGMNEQMNNQ